MKRKIAILLATTMTLTAAPLYAAKTIAPALEGSQSTVASGEAISALPTDYNKVPADIILTDKTTGENYRNALRRRDAVLKLGVDRLSTEDIQAGDTFTIRLENGKFETTGRNLKEFAYRNVAIQGDGKPVNFYVKEDGKLYKKIDSTETEITFNNLSSMLDGFKFYSAEGSNPGNPGGITDATTASAAVAPLTHIPYSINILDETTAEVTFLTSITDDDINKNLQKIPTYYEYANNKITGKNEQAAYFAIPLGAVKSTGGEELKVNVMGFKGTVTNGAVTLAKTISSGSTAIDKSYITKQIFEGDSKTTDLYIRENTKNSFTAGQEVTLRLSSGFKFVNSNVTATNLSNKNTIVDGDVKISSDSTKITFRLSNVNNSEKETIKIVVPAVRAINEDKNYGEVSLEVYGAGITNESVVIAERSKLGFKLETKTEVPTLTKGRYAPLNSSISNKESVSAEFELAEVVPDSFSNRRHLDFTVPAGVKIVDATIVGDTGMGITDRYAAFSIVNEGTTLRLERSKFNPVNTSVSKLRLKLNLSIDIGFQGEEIKVTATGGGISENIEAVIAKAQNPITITAKPKNISVGYQDYAVNDIVITETKPGMFIEGENLVLSLVAPYGTDQMGFTNADVKVTGGDLEVKSVGNGYTNRNQITVNIKTQSRKEPATITISNVKIGTTRSVPFGAYNLEIGGNAIINNDLVDSNNNPINGTIIDSVVTKLNFNVKNDDKKEDKIKRVDAANGSYKIDGYVNVSTSSNNVTDKVMKVTIGSKTAMIGDKEVVMDVAPYLQTGSNAGNTMVPLRFVAVALTGGDASSIEAAQNSSNIEWDAASKTITIFAGTGNQKIIQFRIGDRYMTVDGSKIAMSNGAKAEIKDGRTFVPFRSLGIALGVTVNWDATTKTAIFNQ